MVLGSWSLCASDPLCVDRLVAHHLLRLEPERDFQRGVLGAVAAVDEIVLYAHGEVAAYRRGGCFGSIGRAHESPRNGDSLATFPHHRHRRAGGEELEQ